jgi:hypothetical protein
MSEPDDLNATYLLRSLRLLRSTDVEDRKRGVTVLSILVDDPRVLKVFEHLYENDPDPGVREMVWRVIDQQGPSIPSPKPDRAAPEAEEPAHTAPEAEEPAHAASEAEAPPRAAPKAEEVEEAETPPAPASQAETIKPIPPPDKPRAPTGVLFLLNAANAKFVAREKRRVANSETAGRTAFGLAVMLLLVVGMLWGLALPDWITWYRLRQDGIVVEGEITSLHARNGHLYVIYRFTVGENEGDGVSYTEEQRVSKNTFDKLTENTPVRITYLSDDPKVSRLNKDNPGNVTRDRLTGAAFGLTVLLILLLFVGFVQRHPYALRRNRLIWGQVVSCRGHLDDDGDFSIKLRYSFRSPAGRAIVGQTSQIRNDLNKAMLPDAGTPVAVHYGNDKSYRLF